MGHDPADGSTHHRYAGVPVEHFSIPVRGQEKRKICTGSAGIGDHYRKRQYGFERYKKGKRREKYLLKRVMRRKSQCLIKMEIK